MPDGANERAGNTSIVEKVFMPLNTETKSSITFDVNKHCYGLNGPSEYPHSQSSFDENLDVIRSPIVASRRRILWVECFASL